MAYEYYELLGVGKEASAEELKKAYRKKAMEHHPDRHGGDKDKEAEFKKINEAYAILSDPQKRAAYDQSGGRTDFASGFSGGGFGDFSQGFDINDIFDMFSGGFSGGSGRSRREIGEDIELEISATFEETILGGKRKIAYDRSEICSDCGGSGGASKEDVISCPDCGGNGKVRQRTQTIFGTMEQVVSCPRCHGSGKTVKNPCKSCGGKRYKKTRREKEIEIPAGIEEGMTIKIRGEWHAGKDGDGDLFVHFHAPSEKEGLVREDNDLFYTLKLSPAEMTIGVEHEIELPVLGKRKISVKSGSQHHDRIVFHKEWLPAIPGGRKGDLIIVLEVLIPTKLSAREKELYKELLSQSQSENGDGLFSRLF